MPYGNPSTSKMVSLLVDAGAKLQIKQ